MKLVVGLGNPGRKYEHTRHNVGFDVLAELASRYGSPPSSTQLEGEFCDILSGTEKVTLLAPQTFMNASGRCVRRFVDYYHIALDDILVVCDDLNLPTGKLRLRSSGSAGGQKGLDDIIRHLGTQAVPRLRIGIDRPPGQQDASNYVLGRFSKSEQEAIEHAVLAAADSVELWAKSGIETAMNQVNSSPPAKDSKAGKTPPDGGTSV